MALLTELSEPTTSDVIQARLLECIGEKTDAGARVFAPRDWPTRGDKFPMILVQTPYEKISRQGAGDAIFDATTIVRVIGRVDTIASEDDEGAVVALADLARLQRQIEYAAVNHYKLAQLARLTDVESRSKTSADGQKHTGELTMDFTFVYTRGPEDFAPVPIVGDLKTADIHVDTQNVFDPTGTYADPPFPDEVTPAPRTSGPDGRDEGHVVVTDLDQE